MHEDDDIVVRHHSLPRRAVLQLAALLREVGVPKRLAAQPVALGARLYE